MKSLLLLCVLAVPSLVWAVDLNDWKNAMVKTMSYPCASRQPVFEGSGLLVKTAQGVMVVTSEHVVIQKSDEEICYDIQNSQVGLQRSSLGKVSYLKGMAMLQPTNLSASATQISLDDLNPMNVDVGAILALGTPYGTDQVQVMDQGKIVTLSSQRALIPCDIQIGEFSGLPAEYGDSGGVLLGRDGSGKIGYVGMLSHQVLKRAEGQGTQLGELNAGDKSQSTDLALGILGSEVQTWMKAGAPDKVDGLWNRTLNPDGGERLDVGPFKFDVQPLDSHFIRQGGADGSGIGGADNAGVVRAKKNVISISLTSKSSKDIDLLLTTYPFLKKWYQPLLAGKKISILQMAKKQGPGNYLVKPVSSIDQALTLWMRDHFEPIIYVGNLDQMDQAFEKIRVHSVEANDKISALTAAVQIKNPEVAAWLKRLRDTINLVANRVAPKEDLAVWQSDSQGRYWDYLYLQDFDDTVALNAALASLSAGE